jgi:hypothetical protein
MNKAPAAPIVLTELTAFEAERLSQFVERVRLALGAGNVDRARAVLAEWERERDVSPPVEALLGERSAAVLRRHGIVTIADLRSAGPQLVRDRELSEGLTCKVQRALERLG